jgi:hypothetical protein
MKKLEDSKRFNIFLQIYSSLGKKKQGITNKQALPIDDIL